MSKRGKKPDVYQKVTDRILELLEQGVVPWQNPYTAKVGFPKNFSTGRKYRGANVFLLGSMRYASPWWLTFLQAKELGGHVRKGEKGAMVIKYGTFQPKDEEENRQEDDEDQPVRGYLKCYTVFNASQIDGIDFPEPEPLPETGEQEQLEDAEAIIQGMPNPPAIHIGRKVVACYNSASDTVDVPKREHFVSLTEFFTSAYHELVHSTGHASRLARPSLMENKGMHATGEDRKTYCIEELVAEMGAAFLSAHAGLPGDDHSNSAAYINGWLKVLKAKENRKWIVQAASQAQKAADYILGEQPDKED